MPATMVYNFASAVFRAKGDTKRPLLALTISGVLNAVLNLFFVVPLKMDVAGVGLASSISAYVSAIIVLVVLITDPGFTRLDPRHLYIDGSSFGEIARVGIPAGIQSTVFSVSNVVIQSSINGFGSAAMAGNGAGSSVSNFIYAGMNSFYQTCLTFSSQNMGAGKIERVKKTLILCLLYVAVTGIVLGWGSVFFGRQLLSLYTHDPEVMDYGMIRLRYICLPYFLYGMMDVMVGSLRGMGSSVAPMVVSLLGVCAFRLLWVYTYFQSHPTFEDLFLSYPVSWIITAGTLFVMNLIVYGRLRRKKLSEE
jgi:Na+-driven multidrug efflux pump